MKVGNKPKLFFPHSLSQGLLRAFPWKGMPLQPPLADACFQGKEEDVLKGLNSVRVLAEKTREKERHTVQWRPRATAAAVGACLVQPACTYYDAPTWGVHNFLAQEKVVLACLGRGGSPEWQRLPCGLA